MKKFIIIPIFLLLAVIFVLMFIPKNLTVNSIVIPSEIIEVFENEARSMVFSELSEKYSVTDTSDFWNKRFPEGTAQQILSKKAEENAVEYTLKLQLCTKEVNYKNIIQSFENENQRLRKAPENGEIVYGNTQYTLLSYLKYILLESERLYKSQYSFSDEQLLEIYNKNKEKYKLDDTITVKRISFPYYINGQFDENLYFSQKEKAEAFIKNPDLSLMNEHTFTYDDSKAFPRTYQHALDMQEESISDLIYDEASFEIIYCVKKTPTGYMDFEAAKQSLIRIAEDERFNTEFQNMLQNAKISSH